MKQSPLTTFLVNLLEDGQVTVPRDDLRSVDATDVDHYLREYAQVARATLPADAPQCDIAAARWAAVRFYHACRFVVYRDLGEDLLRRDVDVACERPASASVHYSVDLVFRYLPDLMRFARSAAEQDPLVATLARWAGDWPLSSIGMQGVAVGEMAAIMQHTSLRQLYVDRVIASDDASRVDDPQVREAVVAAIGMYPELAPRLSRLLQATPVKET